MQITETRKILEAEFHDKLRDPSLRDDPELYARLTSNKKWYSVNRKRSEFLRKMSPGA